jgi:predicted negative regulator of RcsB-dependent stress response
MKLSTLFLASALALTVSLTAFAQGKVYVITNEGHRVYGTGLQADRQGNLKLEIEEGKVTRPFQKGEYRAAYTPLPTAVRNLQAAFSKGEFDYIDKRAGEALEKYGYLGWGTMILYIRAKVALDRNEPQQALEYLKRANEYPAISQLRIYWYQGMAETYVALQEYDDANRYIEQILKHVENPKMVAAMFNLKGDINAAQDKKREAALQYMKNVLLFDREEIGQNTYETAKNKLVELLREMNDARYREFENL